MRFNDMTRRIRIISAVVLTVSSIAASAQAQVIMLIPKTHPDEACFKIDQAPNPKWIESASTRADKAFSEYVVAAKAGGSLKKLFFGRDTGTLDGRQVDLVNAADPWATQIQRYERTSLTVSNAGKPWFRATWNAYGSDGELLGRYDALFQAGRGSGTFEHLHLFSPNSTAKDAPMTPFCRFPGDIQSHQQQLRELAAKKAAKR